MPRLNIHCENSKKRTGKEFRDLHEWMDEPERILGIDHRRVRHDLSYIDMVKKKFGDGYVREFLLHISEDYEDTAEKWGGCCVCGESKPVYFKGFCKGCYDKYEKKK